MKEPKYFSILHNPSSKNAMWACKMIPVLIYWATVSKSPHTYGKLSKEVGHHTDQIGKVLGLIDDVFKGSPAKVCGYNILNSLSYRFL